MKSIEILNSDISLPLVSMDTLPNQEDHIITNDSTYFAILSLYQELKLGWTQLSRRKMDVDAVVDVSTL